MKAYVGSKNMEQIGQKFLVYKKNILTKDIIVAIPVSVLVPID